MIKLFVELLTGTWFYFYDRKDKECMKSDSSHYISPEGRRICHPYVAVFPVERKVKSSKSIYDQTKGDSHE